MSDSVLPTEVPPQTDAPVDLGWVWREVRKRVFTKVAFSLPVAETLEAVIPITLEGDHFVVGLDLAHCLMASNLHGGQVKNAIENILRQAAGRPIIFELIEGTTIEEWHQVVERRDKAHEAVIAMASKQVEAHHFEDILNQIVGEIRHRVSQVHERTLPQVRAGLLLDIVPSLADAEEMLFHDAETRESRRAMSRATDRIATFLEVPPLTLALEIERYRREHRIKEKEKQTS
ncbi:hypothetical protein EON80_06775 [bacterium]|nr:MAG: hypothetical protein EON80_06775 [bacterium]